MSSPTSPQKDDRPPRVTPRFRAVVVDIDKTGKTARIPDPSHDLVDVKAGGTVRWLFTNNSNGPMRIGVAHFQIAERYWKKTPDADKYPHPLVPSEATVYVEKGEVGTLTCQIANRTDLRFPDESSVTYEYDIVDGDGKTLLDPEIEIPNQAY